MHNGVQIIPERCAKGRLGLAGS